MEKEEADRRCGGRTILKDVLEKILPAESRTR